MKVQRSHLRIALFILAAAVLYNVWSFMRPAARAAGPLRQQPALETDARPTATGPPAIDPLTIPAPPEVDMSKAPSPGRDPFLFGDETRDDRQEAARLESTPDPVVRSILYSSTRKTAILGNRMVGIGDSVGSLKVTDIERDAVVFTTPEGVRRRVLLHQAIPSGIRR